MFKVVKELRISLIRNSLKLFVVSPSIKKISSVLREDKGK